MKEADMSGNVWRTLIVVVFSGFALWVLLEDNRLAIGMLGTGWILGILLGASWRVKR